MGGEGRNLLQFQVEWHQDPKTETVKNAQTGMLSRQEEAELNPRVAQTLSQELDTERPSRMDTRTHTPASYKMRYKELDRLGSGGCGDVFKALNYDSGKFMAVKRLRIRNENEYLYAKKREVETLARVQHKKHIVEFIHSEGLESQKVLIFMELKDRSLGSLLENKQDMGTREQLQHVAKLACKQMLAALDFLAYHGIIHRDVKPDNVLYLRPQSKGKTDYLFQLGDFGLCNGYNNAISTVGTPIFGPPERDDGSKQTPKYDIWSLMVTMLWTLHYTDFPSILQLACLEHPNQITSAVMTAASKTDFIPLKAMAKINPDERASAAQLLDKYFDRQGLTTRPQHISTLMD
ncbi:MAG: hypothetical protein Q9169_007887 [Polycauliona sp. 2 TL-2023]